MNKTQRKTLKNVKIETNGNCVFIDGKYDSEKNELKVYRYYGDISIIGEAIQNYATTKNIDRVVLKCL